MPEAARYWAVIPAAGSGRRFDAEIPKQYQRLVDRCVVEWAMRPLLDHPRIEGLVVAIAAGDERWSRLTIRTAKQVWHVEGGEQRSDSVRRALTHLEDRASRRDWILVHDAARPCLPRADLDRLIETVSEDPVGGILAAPVSDTLKLADDSERIASTLNRHGVWRALTPQMFRFGVLTEALSGKSGRVATDESMAVEALGHHPMLVAGSPENIKITTRADLRQAERLLRS